MAKTQILKRRGNQHASAETRLAELLDAAEICFGQKGYVGTTIDHIAEQAKLSKGSVYRFFKSKDDILLALLDKYVAKVAEGAEQASLENKTVLERIRVSQRVSLKVLTSVPELVSVWHEFQHHPIAKARIARVFSEVRDDLEKLVDEAILAREIRQQPVSAVVDLLMTVNDGMMAIANADPSFDPLPRFDEVWPLIKNGISS